MKIIKDSFNETVLSYKPKSILDVGSGSGRYYEWSKKYGIEYAGVDIDKQLVKKTSQQYGPKIFSTFNGSDLSKFRDDSYDAILLVEVMEHVKDEQTLKDLLRECARVARNYIFFTTPNSSDEQFLIDHRLIYHHFTHSIGPAFKVPANEGRKDDAHLHHLKFSRDSLAKILKSLGKPFIIEETVPLDIRSTKEPGKVLYFKLWGVIDCQPRSRVAKIKAGLSKLANK